jgi:hypothetical protein
VVRVRSSPFAEAGEDAAGAVGAGRLRQERRPLLRTMSLRLSSLRKELRESRKSRLRRRALRLLKQRSKPDLLNLGRPTNDPNRDPIRDPNRDRRHDPSRHARRGLARNEGQTRADQTREDRMRADRTREDRSLDRLDVRNAAALRRSASFSTKGKRSSFR